MPVVRRETHMIWALDLPHAEAGRILAEVRNLGATILEETYSDTGVSMRLILPGSPEATLARITQGRVSPRMDGTHVVEVT
jgi:hypothetical protein